MSNQFNKIYLHIVYMFIMIIKYNTNTMKKKSDDLIQYYFKFWKKNCFLNEIMRNSAKTLRDHRKYLFNK